MEKMENQGNKVDEVNKKIEEITVIVSKLSDRVRRLELELDGKSVSLEYSLENQKRLLRTLESEIKRLSS
jgi:hypothetical protein